MRNSILLFIIFLTACRQTQTTKMAFHFYPGIADSLREKYLHREIRQAQLFNLPVIFKGVDSFEMRVRYWDVFDMGINLCVLKLDSMGWKGYHYDSYTLFHQKEDGIHVTRTDTYNIGDSVFLVNEFTPLCGWQKFADSLISFKLESLPTQDSIKNFKSVRGFTDGDGYNIEISTRHSYKMLSYFMPEYSPYSECKTVTAFIAFLKRQLGEKYDWPKNLPSTK